MASVEKICRLCSEDCSERPRTRDAKGHYFCEECYTKALQRQRVLQAREAALEAPAEMPLDLEVLDVASEIRVMPTAPRPPRKKRAKIDLGEWRGPLTTAMVLAAVFVVGGVMAVTTARLPIAMVVLLLTVGWIVLYSFWIVVAAFYEGGVLHGLLTWFLPGYAIYALVRSENRLLQAMVIPVMVGFGSTAIMLVAVLPRLAEEQIPLAMEALDGMEVMPFPMVEESSQEADESSDSGDWFNDPVMAMNLAEMEAQRQLSSFLAGLNRSWRGARFAVLMERSYGTTRIDGAAKTEKLWIDHVKLVNGEFRGAAQQSAKYLTGIRAGNVVTVSRDEVVDWLIVDGKTAYGGFTLLAARDFLSPTAVREWRKKYPWRFTGASF